MYNHINFINKDASKNLTPMKAVPKSACTIQWHKELISRLMQKSESIQKARKQIVKLMESNKVLDGKLKERDEEIHRLSEKVSLLLRQLSISKKLHLKALEEIEMLKKKYPEDALKNVTLVKKSSMYDEMEREISKFKPLGLREKTKSATLELDPGKWQTMEYADASYFEMLLKGKHLRNKLEQKINLKQRLKLGRNNTCFNNFYSMLKCRPYSPLKDPTDQRMEFYNSDVKYIRKC